MVEKRPYVLKPRSYQEAEQENHLIWIINLSVGNTDFLLHITIILSCFAGFLTIVIYGETVDSFKLMPATQPLTTEVDI